MTKEQATTTPPPNIEVAISRSKTVSHWKQLSNISISKIVIRCECDQCDSIPTPKFNFTLFDLNLMNNQHIVRTTFPNFPAPHYAAYGPITKTELWNICVKDAYSRGWCCYMVREAWVELLPNGDLKKHDPQYKWISPSHVGCLGGGQ